MTHPTPYDARPINNLPSQPTSFIGRETEIAEIVTLLNKPDCRLLTLVGPGGIGKTRLALEVAERLLAAAQANSCSDGVCFVPLQSLTAAENILAAIAGAVGFQFYPGGEPQEHLLNYFRKKQLMLLLDNFEHLLNGVGLVETILANAPGVQVLVTSREPLKLAWEWRYEVRGMHFPEEIDGDLDHYEAVQLFAGRAQQVRHDFSLDDEQVGVVRICQAVGGMPLALELTASWVKVLSSEQIADEITPGLDILTTDLHDVEPRHRSIQAVFDATWARLSAAERDVLMKLSVFRGGCTREAVEQVTGAGITTLAALVDKSLMRVSSGGRYDLHELVRQYSAEKFDVDPVTKTTTLNRHCDYYANLIHDEMKYIIMDNHSVSSLDMENLQLAWHWSLDNRRWLALQSMAEGLYELYWCQGRIQEGFEQFTYAGEVLAAYEPQGRQNVVYEFVRFYQGALLDYCGQTEQGQQLMLESVALLRQLDCPEEQLAGVLGCSVFHSAVTDKAEAQRFIDESNALAKACGADWRVANNLNSLGWDANRNGDYEVARACFEEALRLYRVPGSMWGMGHIALMDEDYATAKHYLQEALPPYRESNKTYLICLLVWELCTVAFLLADYDEAAQFAQEGYTLAHDMGDLVMISTCSIILSVQAWQRGQPDRAKALAEECLAIRRKTGSVEAIVGTLVILSFIAAGTGDVEEATFCCTEALCTAYNNGVPIYEESIMREAVISVANLFSYTGQQRRAAELLGLVFAKGLALWGGFERRPLYTQLRRDLETELGTAAYNTAWAYGQTLDFHTTFNDLLQEFAPEAEIEARTPNAALVDPLTEREMEVLRLLANGLSNRAIAEELTVVVGTVKAHVYNICQKLGASNRTQAVARARQLKLI